MDMKDDSFFIVHFGELWLRGRNRGTYVAKLMRNIKEALPDHEV
jgi:adenylyl- and sulfurtransferase ThiI